MSYSIDPEYSLRCQPYKCPSHYPDKCEEEKVCIPPGYTPKRYNPGGLKFHIYNYTVQTTGGKPIYPPGRGWYAYQQSGLYPYPI